MPITQDSTTGRPPTVMPYERAPPLVQTPCIKGKCVASTREIDIHNTRVDSARAAFVNHVCALWAATSTSATDGKVCLKKRTTTQQYSCNNLLASSCQAWAVCGDLLPATNRVGDACSQAHVLLCRHALQATCRCASAAQ